MGFCLEIRIVAYQYFFVATLSLRHPKSSLYSVMHSSLSTPLRDQIFHVFGLPITLHHGEFIRVQVNQGVGQGKDGYIIFFSRLLAQGMQGDC